MATDTFEFRVSFKRLLIGLLLIVVPLSLIGLFSITKSDTGLQRTIGAHFKIFAESTADQVSQFIHDRVLNVGAIATEPAIVSLVEAADRSYRGLSDSSISARIQRIESGWNTSASESVVQEVLSNSAAVGLRRYLKLDPRFLRITITDARGATVAATHKTLDYFQADEEYWQAIYADGRGAVNLTDILFDDVTKSSYIGVGVPILEEGTNRFLGTVDALVDVSSLFGVVNQPHPPLNLRTTLVKEDGTIISAPEVDLSMNLKSEEFLAVQDSLTTSEGRQTGYLVSEVPNLGRRVIGFADTGLKQNYKNLSWIVLVSQDARDAFASIRLMGRLMGFLALAGLAIAVLFVVYFSLHRRPAYTDIKKLTETPEKPAAG